MKGKSSKMEIYRRRLKVRDLVLQGYSDQDIMDKLNISEDTLAGDKKAISEQYIKAVTENKYILARQAEHIMKHLDQLQLIKKKLWEIETTDKSAKVKIDTLRTLLQELEHESKILRLIDTSNVIINQYIHIDKINILMSKLAEIVEEFVPPEKRSYCYERLKKLGEILDVEGSDITEESKEQGEDKTNDQ